MKLPIHSIKNKSKLKLSSFFLCLAVILSISVSPLVHASEATTSETNSDSTLIALDRTEINYGLLIAGNSYTQSFTITNNSDTDYSIELSLITNSITTLPAERSQILDWLSFVDTPDPLQIAPQSSSSVKLRAKIPDNALGGGQYATLLISANSDNSNHKEITLPISATISGDTLSYQSEIKAREIAPWYFQNPITASTTIANQGNVDFDSTAEFTVKNPFTGETIYSTADTTPILPGASQTITQSWDSAPILGLFSVSQTLNYYDANGQAFSSQYSRLIIVCPLWLIITISILIILLIVLAIFLVKRHHKNSKKSSNNNKSPSRQESSPSNPDSSNPSSFNPGPNHSPNETKSSISIPIN